MWLSLVLWISIAFIFVMMFLISQPHFIKRHRKFQLMVWIIMAVFWIIGISGGENRYIAAFCLLLTFAQIVRTLISMGKLRDGTLGLHGWKEE